MISANLPTLPIQECYLTLIHGAIFEKKQVTCVGLGKRSALHGSIEVAPQI
jgi:hypothetical protein